MANKHPAIQEAVDARAQLLDRIDGVEKGREILRRKYTKLNGEADRAYKEQSRCYAQQRTIEGDLAHAEASFRRAEAEVLYAEEFRLYREVGRLDAEGVFAVHQAAFDIYPEQPVKFHQSPSRCVDIGGVTYEPETKDSVQHPGWPGEICKRCGRRNVLAWSVPDAVWMSVVGDPGTIWCLTCFDEEAHRFGIKYQLEPKRPAHLAWCDWEVKDAPQT
jgi:hypothetical protein